MSVSSSLINKLLVNQRAQSRQSPLDFLTDPSLLVTILHSLEVAYWSTPLGFVLMPIINFFRVPNKRSSHYNPETFKIPLFGAMRFVPPEVQRSFRHVDKSVAG